MEKETFIIKVKTDHPIVFENFRHYIDYINHTIQNVSNTGLMIEEISDCFLFVYKDLETMRKLNRPYTPHYSHLVNKNKKKRDNLEDKKENKNFSKKYSNYKSIFLGKSITKETFPKEGITLTFYPQSLLNEKNNLTINIFRNFFIGLNDPSLKIKTDKQGLSVFFKNFDSFANYCYAIDCIFPELHEQNN